MKYGVVLLCFVVGCAQAQPVSSSSPDVNQIVSTLFTSLLNTKLGGAKDSVSNPLERLKDEATGAALSAGLNLYNEFARGEGLLYENKDVLSEIFTAGQNIITSYLNADEKTRTDMTRGLLLDVLNVVGISSLEPPFFEQLAEDSAVDVARFLVKKTRSLLGETGDNEINDEDRGDIVSVDIESILGGAAVFLQSFAESYGEQA